jgi:AcrR family transcriptional regulator
MDSHLSTTARRVPQQKRGEQKVSQLLAAAAEVIEEVGYDAATMTVIAQRANTSIGSLYQFFPNKEAITEALRLQYVDAISTLLAEADAQNITTAEGMAEALLEIRIKLLEKYPAHRKLIDAPAPIKNVMRAKIVDQIVGLMAKISPKLARDPVICASVALKTTSGFADLYMRVKSAEKKVLVQEYKFLLSAYFKAQQH